MSISPTYYTFTLQSKRYAIITTSCRPNLIQIITYTQLHIHSQYLIKTPGQEGPPDRHAGGLPAELHFSTGTRVMLLRYLCTEQGLVNGAMELVTHIQIKDGILKLFMLNLMITHSKMKLMVIAYHFKFILKSLYAKVFK